MRPLTCDAVGIRRDSYARPVDGLIVAVDLGRIEVIDVVDREVVPIPDHPGRLHPRVHVRPDNRPAFTELRSDVKPISITQPEGPSFTVDGYQ